LKIENGKWKMRNEQATGTLTPGPAHIKNTQKFIISNLMQLHQAASSYIKIRNRKGEEGEEGKTP
jgi:hypothetical protein